MAKKWGRMPKAGVQNAFLRMSPQKKMVNEKRKVKEGKELVSTGMIETVVFITGQEVFWNKTNTRIPENWRT